MKQLELFDGFHKSGGEKSFKKKTQHTNNLRILRYGLFLIIYTIVVLILGFVLGYDRAKVKRPSPSKAPEATLEKTVKEEPVRIETVATDKDIKVKDAYEIQVASLKKQSSAKTEKETLTKAGFKAYISESGEYIKVCIGPFKTEKEADKNLRALKEKYPKKYKDSFIKKIK
ncbi:MAG: SPOR domain-containing protein [Candidatus Omnitrophica bacterium]|nr:SPOR domain-containing protein [Candidatus Omnitrophota bacterium]